MKPIIKQTIAFLVMLMATIQAFAYDFKLDGIYYNITSEKDRTVEVTHSSDSYFGAISIPKKLIYSNKTYTVTSIGHSAFNYCIGLTSVEIPNSVTTIGSFAFQDCSGLTSVVIPNSVTEIGSFAFDDCSSLTSVVIPNSVTTIGSCTFNYCRGLTSVEIPNSVTTIGNSAFNSCSGLTSIEIPNSVTTIDSGAFQYCSGLTSVVIPNSVTTIGSYTFKYCSGLTSVVIPNSVTEIGSYAFQYCSGLTSVEIPNSVTTIGNSAFNSCSGLTSIEIPNSVTSIGENAFRNCSGLTSVEIQNSVTEIGINAFSECNALKSIDVAEDNETYSSIDGVLYNKDASVLVRYPEGLVTETSSISLLSSTLTSITTDAFNSITEFSSIYLRVDVPPTYNSVFSNDILKNTILYIPKGSLAAYEKADPWRDFWNIEEMDYSGIDEITAGSDFEIIVENGSISVNGNDIATVNVYDISGKLIYSGNDNIITGLNRGMYIVRVGNIARKVII